MKNLQKFNKGELGRKPFEADQILKNTVGQPKLSFSNLALKLELQQKLIGERQETLDLSTSPKILEIFAKPRGGKSILLADLLMQASVRKWSPVALDFPKEGDTSMFSDYIASIEECSNYFDITKQNHNLFEISNLHKPSPKCRKRN